MGVQFVQILDLARHEGGAQAGALLVELLRGSLHELALVKAFPLVLVHELHLLLSEH